jgi:hypothetical protein
LNARPRMKPGTFGIPGPSGFVATTIEAGAVKQFSRLR